jgi:hypothetical protein
MAKPKMNVALPSARRMLSGYTVSVKGVAFHRTDNRSRWPFESSHEAGLQRPSPIVCTNES